MVSLMVLAIVNEPVVVLSSLAIRRRDYQIEHNEA